VETRIKTRLEAASEAGRSLTGKAEQEEHMLGFRLDEVVAARDAARGFSSLLERLRDGKARRFIIVFRNRPQAVILHVSEYERLLSQAGELQQEAA
jgi:hypothetical protein